MAEYFVHYAGVETIEAESDSDAVAMIAEKLDIGGFGNVDIVEVRDTQDKS